MAQKIPKRFRKALPQKKFEKKVLGRVHLPKERAFLDSVFETAPDGTRRVPDAVSDADRKHLASLAKDIKKNRGSLRSMRLIALALVTGGVIVFNIFFLDALLERAGERGLETVFAARSDIEALDFAPFAGSLTVERITVGDRRHPMRNLFELDELAASVNLVELLKGKVVIREAAVATIRTGTERETSATLPGRPDSGDNGGGASGEGSAADRVRDAAVGTFGDVSRLADPQALVEEEISNLESLTLAEEAEEEFSGFTERWNDRLVRLEAEGEDTLALATRVRDIDPETLDTPAEIAEAVALVREASTRVENVADTAREVAAEATGDYETARETLVAARARLERDLDYIASRISLDGVDTSGFVSGLAEDFLIRLLGDIYGTAMRGLDIAERLRREDAADDARGLARAPGRVVNFGGVTYPRFMLERAALGVAPGGMDLTLDGELLDVSSEPQLVGRPTRLSLAGATGGVSLSAESELGYEGNRADALSTTVSGDGFDFRSPEIPQLGELRSAYRFETSLELGSDGDATSRTRVFLQGLDLDPVASDNPVVTAVQDVVAGLDTVDVDAAFRITDGRFRLDELSTSADRAVRDGVRAAIAQRRDEYVARARAEVERRLEARLADIGPLSDQAESLASEAVGLRRTLSQREELIERKREELEARSRALAQEQQDRIEDEARERLEDAAEDLDLDGLGF